MADPITLSFIVTSSALAILGNRADAAAVTSVGKLAATFRKPGTPANHDVLAATHSAFVRSIQSMAEACSRSGGDARSQFVARRLSDVVRSPGLTLFKPDAAAIPKRVLDASIRALFEGADPDPVRKAADMVIASLEQAMGEALTDEFRALFRDGSALHRSWPQAFELFFAEQVKTNEKVFRAFAFDRMNEILALAEVRAGEIAALNDVIAAFRGEMHGRFDTLDRNVQEILARLSGEERDAPIALLRSLAEAFGEARPEADLTETEAYLRAKIGEYHQLRQRIEAVEHEDNHDAALLADANSAIAGGDFDRADRLLGEAEGLLDERIGRLLIRKAERRSLRGEAARLKGDYAAAVAHFDAATAMLPESEGEARRKHGWSAVFAAEEWGERIEPAAMADAVCRWRALLAFADRNSNAENWGALQNNLGNALAKLGERQQGTAALDEAVVAFRAALEVRTRERLPLDWAMTQNNLGTALRSLGERREGNTALNEAIAAYRAALEVRTRDRMPIQWATTQNNLGSALQSLGERQEGTAALGEAVAAFRASLEVRMLEGMPLQWASSQNNLGNALRALGQRQEGTEALDGAVVAFHAALEIYTRERQPLNWAMTQNNLGNAFAILGERQQGTEAIDWAIAAYRNALEVYIRERLPLDWAMTQNNLGGALSMLGARLEGTEPLDEAVAAYRAAQEVRTRERLPLQWALTEENIGYALCMKAEKLGDCETAEEAVAAIGAVLAAFAHPDLRWHRDKAAHGLIVAMALRDRLCGGADAVNGDGSK